MNPRAGGRRARVVTLRFATPGEATEFLHHVVSRVSNVAAEQSGSLLKIILLAPSGGSEDDYRKLLALLRQWRLSRQSPRRGVYKHDVSLLLSSANLKVGIPLAAVVDTLSLMGFQARMEGPYLVTNATFERVVKAAEEFSRKYAEALEVAAPPLVRRLIAVTSTAFGQPVDEALEKLVGMGVIKLDEATKKYVLAVSYNEALNEVRRRASGLSLR